MHFAPAEAYVWTVREFTVTHHHSDYPEGKAILTRVLLQPDGGHTIYGDRQLLRLDQPQRDLDTDELISFYDRPERFLELLGRRCRVPQVIARFGPPQPRDHGAGDQDVRPDLLAPTAPAR